MTVEKNGNGLNQKIITFLLGLIVTLGSLGFTLFNMRMNRLENTVESEIKWREAIREEQVVNTERIIRHQAESDRGFRMIEENQREIDELKEKLR